jgi:nucleoside-diphosphate-sugar epimerase
VKLYLIGGRGRLGQAIAHEYVADGIVSLDRSVYEDWSHVDSVGKIARFFEKSSNEGAIVFVTSGLLDPKLAYEDLLSVNCSLPKNLIDGVAELGVKVVTFGTVMERLLESKNPYVRTKAILAEYVRDIACAGAPVTHIQVHTLYGLGEPSPFMFLGQMLSSVKNDTPFNMTSGRQLREYHHLEDEAKAIRHVAHSALSGVMSVNHGMPISLRTLAEEVFRALGKPELLHIGALPEPAEENYAKILEPSEVFKHISFRDPLSAVIQYMRKCYSSPEA